ncbi:uncharacterized protein [Aristolochia californica]|uniref:uncharacterized protein n=1 Tax=Aristolochia californica TaxID=171875 RepID=UPI0035D818F6
MSSTSRAWVVATSIGAVEALKDQGFARWNYALRSFHLHATKNIRSYAQARRLCPSIVKKIVVQKQQAEDSLRKVMYLSCWVPN